MAKLILIGMPGCGKSTLGVLLAKALMMDFIDTDLLMQKQYGKPLQQLVDELGTAGFSDAEEQCILGMDVRNTVIATGGSVALEEKAMQHLSQSGTVAFIRLAYETVHSRLSNISTRGIAMEKGQTLKDLYDLRQPYYERWAEVVIDADQQHVEESVQALMEALRTKEDAQS